MNSDIGVHVATTFIDEQSEPQDDRYVFAYTVTIRNNGDVAATLRSRHWIITDSNGKVQEVQGDGVVGEQPFLRPGEEYRYSSGAILETPVGAMHGKYIMEAEDGNHFDAPIAPFSLAVPGLLQ